MSQLTAETYKIKPVPVPRRKRPDLIGGALVVLAVVTWISLAYLTPGVSSGGEFSRTKGEFVDGRSFTTSFAIVNRGPFSIRVTSVDAPTVPQFGPRPMSVLFKHGSRDTGINATTVHERFRPFRVAPGEKYEIGLRGTFLCPALRTVRSPGTQAFTFLENIRVHYRVLGFWRSIDVHFPNDFDQIILPTSRECPKP